MSVLRQHSHFGLVRWLAVIALLLPLLLPTLPGETGTIVSRATVSADIFATELCTLTHAVQDQNGGQLPVDHHDQHCPLCVSIQHLGSCLAVESPVALAAVDFIANDVPRRPIVAYSSDFHSPGQPRAPPVRV